MKASYIALSLLLLAVIVPVYSYDENLARELVGPAGITYCKQADQRSLTCGTHCTKMKAQGYQTLFAELLPNGPVTSEAFSIFYKPSQNRIVVSFRGTSSPVQLMQEFMNPLGITYALQSGFPNVRITTYFYNRYKNTIRTKLFQDIKSVKAKYPTASYIITGHSLGAALATLAAFDLSRSGMIHASKMQVYNYGSPRVGNFEFVAAFAKERIPIYRIVNSRDPVAHVPPCIKVNGKCSQGPQKSGPIWAPYHVNNEYYYPDANMRGGQYKVCHNEDNNCSKGVSIIKYNLNTHLYYFGQRIGCA